MSDATRADNFLVTVPSVRARAARKLRDYVLHEPLPIQGGAEAATVRALRARGRHFDFGVFTRVARAVFILLWLAQFLPAGAALAQGADSSRTNAAGASAGAHFTVEKYLVNGNTILSPAQISQVLSNHPSAFGTNVTFNDIRAAMADLQAAYRERGFVAVSVALPQQKLTNAEVKFKVTEGRLADIKVEGNKYFSTENVLRALPGLKTNMLLNSHVFQRDLDQANANRNRQIYPAVGPGPDPGTTELTLKVKDRLPLHARGELDNLATPGTPDTRAVFNMEYDNLWQLEHTLGVSYSFTPVDYHGKGGDYYWWPLDLPIIGNYSAFYRLPLGTANSAQQQIDDSNGQFGYNEVTHQFQVPPPSGRPELTLYASRSVVDTTVKTSNAHNVTNTPLFSIGSFDTGQNLTLNENIGTKLNWPAPQLGRLASTLSLGMDLKHFRQVSYNSNNFVTTVLFTNSNGSVSPISSLFSSPQPVLRTEVYYFPLNVGVSGSLPDSWGTTFFNGQANFNLGTFGGLSQNIATVNSTNNPSGTNRQITVTRNAYGGMSVVTGNSHVHDGYITLQFGADRQQRIYKDWTVKLHADGQWANGPLISNEQYGMGGVASVRGYQDGEVYGDAGWRISIEPQTPMIQFGTVDGDRADLAAREHFHGLRPGHFA